MSNNINWEITMPFVSNSSPQEIINITNSLLALDFKNSLEHWLNEQIQNKNLKGFKKNKYPNKYPFYQKDSISILDLKFKEKIYNFISPSKYNENTHWWDKIPFNNEVFLRTYSYTLKIPLGSKLYDISQEDIKISIPEPWFVYIYKIYEKELKTQKNITIHFSIGLRYYDEIKNEELYPNVDCTHDFKILYNRVGWHLIWECKKCGFICFCSCFRDAIEGCKQGITVEKKHKTIYGKEKLMKSTNHIRSDQRNMLNERGFTLKDMNLDINMLPYYENACEVCREKTSSHKYTSKMYARSDFEIKYGAYVKKKFFELKLSHDFPDLTDDNLEIKANNIVREELGFRKIGERFVTETELYRIIKSLYPNYKVLHHYRSEWLGKQELDIFIPKLKLAIEYDGIQHFKPIEAWGGEEGLKKNIERDKMKEEKCLENNVNLVRFTYKESDLLNENYVKSKLKSKKLI